MDKQIHHIKKQVFEIKLKDKNKYSEIREKISSANYEVLKALDALFNDYFTGDKVVMIDKLEIDLGNITVDEIEHNLSVKIKEKLIIQLDQKMGGLPGSGKIKLVTPEGKIVTAVSSEMKNLIGDSILSKEDFILKVVSYFLRTGLIPWYASGQIENMGNEIIALIKTCPEKTTKILSENITSVNVRERIAKQFPNEIVIEIARLYNDKSSEVISPWFKEMQYIFNKLSADKNKINFIFYLIRLAIIEIIGNNVIGYISDKIILQYFVRQIMDKAAAPEEILTHLHSAVYDFKKVGHHVTTVGMLPGILKSILASTEKNLIIIHDKMDIKNPDLLNEKVNKINAAVIDENELTSKGKTSGKIPNTEIEAKYLGEKVKEELPENQININNAGLVLLTPFFIQFFKNLNLTREDKFWGYGEQIKAVQILQYLAAGTENNPENVLVLNKLLCGIDISFPIEREIILSESDKHECGELLLSVIRHWRALKNISVSGFRESFLMRNGLLDFDDYKVLLRVDQKAFDMLLNKLPWSFSIVSLPWMKKNLYVEWQRL